MGDDDGSGCSDHDGCACFSYTGQPLVWDGCSYTDDVGYTSSGVFFHDDYYGRIAAVANEPALGGCFFGVFAASSDPDSYNNAAGHTRTVSPAVQSVWRDNCAEAFAHLLDMLRRPHHHLYIAFDLEFVADASTDVRFRPFSLKEWYHHLHAFVNGGDVVQVGLALAFELINRHAQEVIALEINMKFDEDVRQYNAASIGFLAKQGHRLAEHRDRGVTAEQLIDGILCNLPFGDESVTWITYHGDRDVGFLLRFLQPGGRGALPPERAAFMRQVRRAFPVFYDVRVLGQLVKEGFSGKLTALAELLGVQRVGAEHHAGSDALLTMSCFSEIVRLSQHELRRLDSLKCLLSGMEELDMAIKCARRIDDVTVKTVDVTQANFDEGARWIQELVTSNFKIVGVHVTSVSLPRFVWANHLCSAAAEPEQRDYDLIKSSFKGIGEFQVVIGFMNAQGMLALGRVWKFHLRCSSHVRTNLAGENSSCVDPQRFAWLLASCGATHNPDVVWATYRGSEGIACLIKSSMVAGGDLPDDCCSYNEHRRARFPTMYDVGLIAQRWPDTGVLPTGCRGTLYDIAINLKLIMDEDRHPTVVLLCFFSKFCFVCRCW